MAEAAAILRKAEAWKEFNDAARLQTILEKMPAILEASTGIFGAVAAPLGNIDKLVVIDQGNGSGRRQRRPCADREDQSGRRVQPAAAARSARTERAVDAAAAWREHDVGVRIAGPAGPAGDAGTAAAPRK